MWDTSSAERFRSITTSYFKGASCALIVYDVTEPETLEAATRWIKDVRDEGPENVMICLCGNKIDLEDRRKITSLEGREFAEKFFIDYHFCVSALTNEGLDDMMYTLAADIHKKFSEELKSKLERRGSIQLERSNSLASRPDMM